MTYTVGRYGLVRMVDRSPRLTRQDRHMKRKQTVTTASDVRKIALALNGVSEVDHWDRPSYRTTKRIFAVMPPDGLYLDLPEERKEFLFDAAPEIFLELMWGKSAKLIVQITKLSKKELESLMREAWESATPPTKPTKVRAAATARALRKTLKTTRPQNRE